MSQRGKTLRQSFPGRGKRCRGVRCTRSVGGGLSVGEQSKPEGRRPGRQAEASFRKALRLGNNFILNKVESHCRGCNRGMKCKLRFKADSGWITRQQEQKQGDQVGVCSSHASGRVRHRTVPAAEGGRAGPHSTVYTNSTSTRFCPDCEFSVGILRIKQSFHSLRPNIIIPIFVLLSIHSDGVQERLTSKGLPWHMDNFELKTRPKRLRRRFSFTFPFTA